MTRRRRPDSLMVQVALSIKKPKGTRISKKVLEQILDRIANNKPLPKNVSIRGIFWRNPNRKGKLSYWRWHFGADVSALKSGGAGVESSPRGNLQSAIDSLAVFIEVGSFTF